MMNSPAHVYFRPMSADLEAGGWLSAMFTTGAQAKVMVFENIRKGGTKLVSHDLCDSDAVASVAASLSEKYPEVPQDQLDCMVERSRTLFTAVGALSFRSSISTSSYCQGCGGLETDEVHFDYFPPMPGTPLDQGSLSVLWSKCCKKGRPEGVEVFGTIAEAADGAREILTAMLDTARPETQSKLGAAIGLIGADASLR